MMMLVDNSLQRSAGAEWESALWRSWRRATRSWRRSTVKHGENPHDRPYRCAELEAGATGALHEDAAEHALDLQDKVQRLQAKLEEKVRLHAKRLRVSVGSTIERLRGRHQLKSKRLPTHRGTDALFDCWLLSPIVHPIVKHTLPLINLWTNGWFNHQLITSTCKILHRL